MDRVLTFLKLKKPQKGSHLRDSKGRPYYLVKLPFYKRNPKFWVMLVGSTSGLFMYFSPFIFSFFDK